MQIYFKSREAARKAKFGKFKDNGQQGEANKPKAKANKPKRIISKKEWQ